ncbi:hypothetical protein V9K67_21880 [Paraflavisolibacter sp. H34]|uniref:hypothetical protein n=1 Tax=Huijunlia imazamoxiresistens TaxID=3127457 RepID=UPI003018E42B
MIKKVLRYKLLQHAVKEAKIDPIDEWCSELPPEESSLVEEVCELLKSDGFLVKKIGFYVPASKAYHAVNAI